MSNWRTKTLQDFRVFLYSEIAFLILVLLLILILATNVRSQTQATNLPGPSIREGNRAMDDYDRTINRMKNDAKAANERRRNLFPQINEDFQRIQVIHNEIVRMLQPDKTLNFDRLAELSEDMKKRVARLRENLALPQAEKTDAPLSHTQIIDETQVKKTIVALHDLIVEFVGNPLFKNLGVIDAKVIETASENLGEIINTSDEIKREAKVLSKSARK
ncbi:MAG: hypothetical protein C5B55_11400 [Blastocatellia bacterium]|nr:MAG: hypothetical protein C5B55_11400 [Blastocatellia bacterium]